MTNIFTKQMESETITTMKLASYPLVAWILSYTQISHEVITILAAFLFIDVVTGLLRVALTEPQKLSSRTGIIGILSKLLVILIPLVIALVGKGAGYDLTQLVDLSLKFLIVYEAWSILGNIVQIRTKDTSLNEYDAVSLLIKSVQDIFKRMLGSLTAQVPQKGEEVNQK